MSVVEVLRGVLSRRPEVELAALFGSAARSRGAAGEDVDVAVLVRTREPSSRLELEAAVSRAVARPTDVVYLDEAPPLLRFEIARDGILLVESRPYQWADFKARAMLDWWDWAPTVRRLWAASLDRLRRKVGVGQT